MKANLKHILTQSLLFCIPILSILFLEILIYVPRVNEFFNFLRLSPFYIGIYYWHQLRPDIFNIFSAFILGIFADVLSSSILGINVLSFLILHLISSYMFSYFNIKKFIYSWLLFSVSLLITEIFKSIIISISYQTIIPIPLMLYEFVLTTALYPIICRFYLFIETRYIHLEERYENQ